VWCGVVWCGVVWCGVVWCGVVCVVWCGVCGWCVGGTSIAEGECCVMRKTKNYFYHMQGGLLF
jgi:hypothetical protein